MVNVTKADGTKQPFDKRRLVRTAMRLRATPEYAEEVATKIEKKMYEGITTKKILKMLFSELSHERPELKHIIDLREAVSMMKPKPDFEHFIGMLMREYGYDVKMNRIVNGRCVDHEIDVIAQKGKEVLYIEVKHHYQFHSFTGMDVFLEVNSTMEDLVEGFLAKKNPFNFTKPMVVMNTKVSAHAEKYAACRDIGIVGWAHPKTGSLEDLIEEKSMYPVTLLKGLGSKDSDKLFQMGILTLRQLMAADRRSVLRKTGMPKRKLEDMLQQTQEIIQRPRI